MVRIDSPVLATRLEAATDGAAPVSSAEIEFVANTKKSSLVERKDIKPVMLEMLATAKRDVIMEMAYFGDPDITKGIIDAAKRGVTIKIILPGKADIQDDLNRSVVKDILRQTNGKVQIYFLPRMTHVKCTVSDGGEVCYLGSANMNTQSTVKMSEMNIIVRNPLCRFTQEIRKQLDEDLAASKLVTSADDVEYNAFKASLEKHAAPSVPGPLTEATKNLGSTLQSWGQKLQLPK
jgi:phosphatidylserine/phosphatidylglycerophosphate/cardiolipin synthase-like enzyme